MLPSRAGLWLGVYSCVTNELHWLHSASQTLHLKNSIAILLSISCQVSSNLSGIKGISKKEVVGGEKEFFTQWLVDYFCPVIESHWIRKSLLDSGDNFFLKKKKIRSINFFLMSASHAFCICFIPVCLQVENALTDFSIITCLSRLVVFLPNFWNLAWDNWLISWFY